MVSITERGVRFGSRPDISARSVLVTILGDSIVPTGGSIWLRDLIELAAPFGFSDRLVRTSMYRLGAEGWFNTDRVGRRSRYELTDGARREFAEAEERIYQAARPQWDGEWTLVFLGLAGLEPNERENLATQLSWQGFARLAVDLLAFPGEARKHVDRLSTRCGIDVPVPVATARFDDVAGLARSDDLAAAFELGPAADRYRAFIDEYRWTGSTDWSDVSDVEAFIVRTMVVHEIRRPSLIDPRLPASLLPPDWPGDRARALAAEVHRAVNEPAWRWLEQTAGLSAPPTDSPTARRFGSGERSTAASSRS
jgi:phenylacetic acid degradation operon negative regulatory protein